MAVVRPSRAVFAASQASDGAGLEGGLDRGGVGHGG